ncbi:MAG TPA: serine/threonine-protein kinase [Solirubrobacterales bacterium]|nr:serine/threonine-protein kinase [Solirubrobacterales bacterium]
MGERILGRFLIEARIGSGGFGTVYRAWDERLQRSVAVKVIDREEGGPRVMREAQAVARLAHRNIATLYELAGEDGRAYLVSELIEGETLRTLARRGDLSDRLVAEIGADCAAALAHAHRAGVVHRDVKPENVIVAAGGAAKLVDFGIARITGERTLTGTGDVLGTLAYMAPEQADGQRPGPGADVYSLALTLYECLCGEHPLIRESPAATARAIGEEIAPIADVRPDLPAPLADAIDASLDPDPELRPLASELESVLDAHSRKLDGAPLPAVLRPDFEDSEPAWALPAGSLLRFAPGLSIGVLTLCALLALGAAPAIVLLAAPAAGLVAVGRPRAGLGLGTLVTLGWLLAGAGEPGTAFLVTLLAAPLFAVPIAGEAALALPALAPLLGAAGLGAAYPALAGLCRGMATRALLGAIGCLWMAAAEIVSGRTFVLGPDNPAPRDWEGSVGAAIGDVITPLLSPQQLALTGAWALGAAILPLLVRGRSPLLDGVGALIWAAGLISAHRLVAGPDGEPAGLFVAALLAAVLAAFAAPRLRHAQGEPEQTLRSDRPTGVHA